jgi:uncharacterized protein YbjT (DUF2867 family)
VSSNDNRKAIPRSVLIFGAAGHIGGPLARFLRKEAPGISLRLVSSNPARRNLLRRDFSDAEVVSADYFDLRSMELAVQDIEGIWLLTPASTDEAAAMTNLVAAVKNAGTAVHILRGLGLQPEANPRRIPQSIREARLGLPIQHPIAKQILDESALPVTYLNFGATFMDNFLWMKKGLVSERKLIWHNRLIPFIDPRDIGEVAGRLLLSDNHRHIGQFHTLNNGHDLMRFSDVADVMSEVFGEKITHDGSKEAFFDAYAHLGEARNAMWDFFEYERANEVVWARNDFVARTLGRQPVTVRAWLHEHAQALLS